MGKEQRKVEKIEGKQVQEGGRKRENGGRWENGKMTHSGGKSVTFLGEGWKMVKMGKRGKTRRGEESGESTTQHEAETQVDSNSFRAHFTQRHKLLMGCMLG